MAVIIKTSNPLGLLQAMKEEMAKRSIETWTVDSDGDFYHTPPQWSGKAWLRPFAQEDRIVFKILGQKNIIMGRAVYAVYHGRFIEMMLNHFDTKFSEAEATAFPAFGDSIGVSQ